VATFPFNDLHSFKDYVGFVSMCAPDSFPPRKGVLPSEQWSLDLAFAGLREGLKLAEQEKGPRAAFSRCREMFDAAYQEYLSGNSNAGFTHLSEAQKLLKRLPSQ
jgi:hypothetical protein